MEKSWENRYLKANATYGVNSKWNIMDNIDDIEDVSGSASAEGPSAEYYTSASGGWYSGGQGVGSRGGATVGKASTHGPNVGPTSYSGSCDIGSERVAVACAGARATTGRADAHWNMFGVEVEGPTASVGAHARHIPYTPLVEVGAMAELSAAKAGVNAGPAFAKMDVNVNTGAKLGTHGAEVNFLGFGLAVGQKTGFNTPLGSLGFKFW